MITDNYLLFTVCMQLKQWLLKIKLFFGSNTHPSFRCHRISHYSSWI